MIAEEGTSCADGVYCNGDEVCDATGNCQPGTPVNCDDEDVCTGVETCDETTDSCVTVPGTPVNCDDNDDCTADYCDPLTGDCSYEPICTSCETAWAYLDTDTMQEPKPSCFAGTGNWGWYWTIPKETILTDGSYDISGVLYAGAAGCDLNKGTAVGTATVTVTATGYNLDLNLNSDCEEEDLHVWVSNSPPPNPNKGFKGFYQSYEATFKTPLNLNAPIYVAVHTSTCCFECNNDALCTYE